MAGGDHQQVQVMIAQHDAHRIAQPPQQAQHAQRLRSSIDQVADQPQAVVRGVEGDALEQACKRRVTTLDVADSVSRHALDQPARVATT